MRRTVLGLVSALAVTGVGATAAAQEGALAIAVELEAGARTALSDSAQRSDEDAPFLMTAAAGVYPSRNVRIALEGRFDLAEGARHHEVLGTLSYFLDLRLLELYAGLGVGRYWRDIESPGFSDRGFVIEVHGGARVGLVGPLSASIELGHTLSESQHDDPVWANATQIGAALALKL